MALKHHFHSLTLCNSPSSNFKHGFHFLLPKHPSDLHIHSHFTTHSASNQQQEPNISRKFLDKFEKGFSSFGDKDKRVSKKISFLGQNGDKERVVSKKVTFLGENDNGVGSSKVENGEKGRVDSSFESKEQIVSKKGAFLGQSDNGDKERMVSKKVTFVGGNDNGVGSSKVKDGKKGRVDSSLESKERIVSKKAAFLGQNDDNKKGDGLKKGKNVSFEDKERMVSKKVSFLGEDLDNGNGVGLSKVKDGKWGRLDSYLESKERMGSKKAAFLGQNDNGDKERMVSKKVTFLGGDLDNGNGAGSSKVKNGKKGRIGSSFESKERMVSKKVVFLGDGMDNENARKEQLGVNLDCENVVEGKKYKRPKKGKLDSPVIVLRIGLEICSKLGDVMGAIRIFDLAKKEGITLGQYHYAVILYLCSSAAVGVVQPAKSGRSGTNSDKKSRLLEEPSGELDRVSQTLDDVIQLINDHENSKGRTRIEVGDNVKEYALNRGFEIYEEMVSDDVPANEAILTSLARMAMSRNDGDMAFDMVKKMKGLGINPRLRSYGPALSVFCNNGNLEKAFEVEEHMLSHGVYPEEPELELLLRVSIEACRSDKVYYLLHKLRTSVRKVLPSTADVIESWFNSKTASRVGKRKWDQKLINEATENGGGGWHGQGWLGSGKWNVKRSFVGKDGSCKCCGEKLVTIDLDPVETERFAESVAKIAKQRDKNSSFEKFQKWLDYYGPFEAVVDGANVGLFSQRRFKPSKVNTIANGIRQMLPSKKWPLVILHNRRITGDKMNEGLNKTLVEKWKTADALYATPTGSNDDWYWLYAAIKFKCLLVTNDEMRDHLFQLLGNDFFPKWKERHQVRFNFCDTGPVYHMPPPCSVVIQESSKGHWHIPIASEQDSEEERVWVCVTRDKSSKDGQESINVTEESGQKELPGSDSGTKNQQKTRHKHTPQEVHRGLRRTLLSSLPINQDTILTRITTAEKLSQSIIDFQI